MLLSTRGKKVNKGLLISGFFGISVGHYLFVIKQKVCLILMKIYKKPSLKVSLNISSI